MSERHQIFGDWRDLRGAIERAFPEFMGTSVPEDKWDFCVAVLREYHPLRAKCYDCGSVVSWNRAYRCADCNGVFCEDHIKPHFGPNHRSHERVYPNGGRDRPLP